MEDDAAQGATTRTFAQALLHASPVMLAYLSIGVPCGVLESKVGLSPLMAFLFSCTYYSGAGQFMLSRMALAGSPAAAIATTISFMNTRQILYSTALSAYFADEGPLASLLFATTVTDETFGVNLDRLESGEGWPIKSAIVTNLLCTLSWASANALGAALGPVINAPLALLSFGMTAIFICLTLSQPLNRGTVSAMVASCVAVGLLKLAGLGNMAVLVGAVVGVVAGVVAGEVGER